MRHPAGTTPLPNGSLVCMSRRTSGSFSLPTTGRFSCSRLRGTQGARVYPTAQVLVPVGLRGARSGRSKSRHLASNRGIAFRRTRANQAHGNPQHAIYVIIFPSFHLSAAVFEVPQQPSKARQPLSNSRASSFSLCDSHEGCFCVWARERACVRESL